MSWEHRERGGRYYTRSYREDGRIKREYVGTGEIAEAVAHADGTIRRRREEKRRRELEELGGLEALVAASLEISSAAEALVAASLVAGGCHKRKGEWRRERST